MGNQPDRLKDIEQRWRDDSDASNFVGGDIEWLIAEVRRLRAANAMVDIETPTYTTDRFITIKSHLADMDASGCLPKNSALRWLVDEVHRLRVFRNSTPVEEISLVMQHSDYGNSEVATAMRFIQLWLKWVSTHH